MNLLSGDHAEGRPATAGRPPRFAPRLLATASTLIAASGAIAYFVVGDPGVSTAAGAERVEIVLDEWTLATDVDSVEAGPITFAIRNEGEVDHEFLVLKTETDPGALPQGLSGVQSQLVGDLVVGKQHSHRVTYAVGPNAQPPKGHITPGSEIAIDVDLKPGSYALYCNLSSHYGQGQWSGLEVR